MQAEWQHRHTLDYNNKIGRSADRREPRLKPLEQMRGGHQATRCWAAKLLSSPKLLRRSRSAPPLPARALMRIGSVQPSAGRRAGRQAAKLAGGAEGRAGAPIAGYTRLWTGSEASSCVLTGAQGGWGAVLRTSRSRTACSVLASAVVPGAMVAGGGAGSPASAPAQGRRGRAQQHGSPLLSSRRRWPAAATETQSRQAQVCTACVA